MTEPTPTNPATSNDRRTFLSRAALGSAAAAALILPTIADSQEATAASPTKKSPTGHRQVFNVRDFGAKGNGTSDDTKKIQKAIAAAQSAGGGTVYLPSGTYKTTSTLVITKSRVNIQGEGDSSTLACSFANGDILQVKRAAGSTALVAENYFSDFAIISSLAKTGGAAISLDGVQDIRIANVSAVSRTQANNLYDVFSVHDFTLVLIDNCKIQGRNKGVTIWGHQVGADIWLTGGTLCLGTPVGVHVGGGVGGVYFNEFLCFQNGENVVIDDTLGGSPNREIFFNEAILDGSWRHNVEIKENGVYVVAFQNTWIGNAGFGTKAGHPEGCLVRVHPGAILHPSNITVSGCKMFNAYGSGIYAESGAWTITGSDISLNGQGAAGGYGVLLTGDTSHSVINGNTIRTNGAYPGPMPLGVGIKIESSVDNYLVTSNLLTSNGTGALVDEGGPSKIVSENLGA